MAYKIPNTPTYLSTPHEIADYLEILCILSGGHYSTTEAHNQICYPSDEIVLDQNIQDDDLNSLLQEALGEMDRRRNACKNRYPFKTAQYSISLDNTVEKTFVSTYEYLLFATRLNMIDNKVMNGVDGTLLFESLSSEVARTYFGVSSKSLVFGTSVSGGFREKVEDLIKHLGEGGGYKDPEGSTHAEKDGSLDVVVWTPFPDDHKGKLIGFGQCKTGTSWRMTEGSLVPEEFCRIYFLRQPFHVPVKLFFVAESFWDDYEKIATKAGIIFERCRIMSFLPDSLPDNLISDINDWLSGALKEAGKGYTL